VNGFAEKTGGDCPSIEVLEYASISTACLPPIEKHVASCAQCAARIKQLREDAALMRELATATQKPATIDTNAPREITGYTRIEELHRGGQGVLWKAIQADTNRLTVIKSLRHGHFASDEERARFQREIELVGRLRHPGIVTVFGSGTTPTGERYIAMEYVDGLRLDEWARIQWGEPPSWTASDLKMFANLFVEICDAVGHAQQRGIIHRDLKPSNLLIDDFGKPHVLDFGVAKECDEQAAMITHECEFVGTYAYASPEQFKADRATIGTWTDVYSIGVMAFEVMTGRRPHEWTGSLADFTQAVCEDSPPNPRQLNPSISRDLSTIIVRSLATDPSRRYNHARTGG